MKYILYPFLLVAFAVFWCVARVFCFFGSHWSGLEIKHWHLEKGVEVVTVHEVHCSFCDHVEYKV